MSDSASQSPSSDQPFELRPLLDYPQRESVLAAAAQRAGAVDANESSPFETLRELGEQGLLDLGLEGSIAQQAAVVHDLASECTATAFSLWAHRSSIEYLSATGREIPRGMREGTEPASSAMAPAFKAAAGIGEITVSLTEQDGRLVLDGTIPWASNLYPEGWIVLPATRRRDDGTETPVIVLTRDQAPGVSVKPLKDLMALDATASGILRFESSPIEAQDVLSEDVPGFLAAVRGPFLLLQSSFCLGLAGAALASADAAMTGAAEVFRPERDEVVAEFERVRAAVLRMADSPREHSAQDLLQTRLDAALLTGAATRLEGKTVGGKGYAMSSPTARRAREAAFLPVQSPTESHLRWELRKLG